MITIVTRDITETEKSRYRKAQPGTYKRFESFVIRILFIVFLGIIPMLVYDKYFLCKSEKNTQCSQVKFDCYPYFPPTCLVHSLAHPITAARLAGIIDICSLRWIYCLQAM